MRVVRPVTASLVAFALLVSACGTSSEPEGASDTTAVAEETTTTQPTTTSTTRPPTTTTTVDVVEAYCAASREANVVGVQYELDNGPGSSETAEGVSVSLDLIRALEHVPSELEADFALTIEGVEGFLSALTAKGSELTTDELLEVWTPERQEAAQTVDLFDEETCGFTYDRIALEMGLHDTTDAVAALAADIESDPACTAQEFDLLTPDELSEVGLTPEGVAADYFTQIADSPAHPAFEAFLLTLSKCAPYFDESVREANQGGEADLLDCYIAHASLRPNVVAAYLFGTSDGSSIEDSYSAATVDRLFAGLDEEEELIDEILSQPSCPTLPDQ